MTRNSRPCHGKCSGSARAPRRRALSHAGRLAVLPVPGGRSNLHGPLWIALLIGIAVFLAGVCALIQASPRECRRRPAPDAPQWIRVAQYLIGVALFVAFVLIGSWVAFGNGRARSPAASCGSTARPMR